MGATRQTMVPPERLAGWVERFTAGNGPLAVQAHDGGVLLRGANGCVAVLRPPWESAVDFSGAAGASTEGLIAGLISSAERPRRIGLLLVRRGGYAVGVAEAGALISSKTGTRYVQSRTAAGGWSQQRFARRRANQASGLAEAAAGHAVRIFEGQSIDCLQLGGDRPLASEALDHQLLHAYRSLPQLKFLVVPDPRLDVLRKSAADARSIRITVTDP